jgi:myo-inositol 2-dehydrogenase/D-chiro-inositol 1-dehydrogenase
MTGLHVGVLGVGRIGSFHTRTLADHGLVDRITIWDPQDQTVAALREQLPIEVAESPDDVLVGSVDAVLICSSSATHAGLLRETIARGVPTFCEKPLATSLPETRVLAAVAEAAGALVTVGFQRRSDPQYRALKEQVERGELGTLYLARLVIGDEAPPPADYLATSGGLFVDQSVHDFDILRYLTGQDIVEVYATGTRLTGAPGFAESDDTDTAVTMLKLSDGTFASLTSSRHSAAGYDVRLELAGSKGVRAVGLTESRANGEVHTPSGGFLTRFAGAYRAEIAGFLDYIRGAGPNPCSVGDAVAALEVAMAATESLRTGSAVRVDTDG